MFEYFIHREFKSCVLLTISVTNLSKKWYINYKWDVYWNDTKVYVKIGKVMISS